MTVLSYLAAGVCGLCAALAGLAFTITFAAWIMCDPLARRGPFRPRPWLFLAAFTVLSALTYALLP